MAQPAAQPLPPIVEPSGAAAEALAAAQTLTPWLRTQAARIEHDNRIPDDVVARLDGAGILRLSMPRRHGGLGLAPADSWRAIMAIASGCSSCGWVTGLGAANVLMLGGFPDQAQADVFGCGRPTVVPMLTGGVGLGIQVQRVADGGIQLSGRWRYASGIDVASWVGLLVPVPDRDGGAPEPHVVLVPQDAFAIDHESWRVLGMRGTGSKTVSLAHVKIPVHRMMRWADLQAGHVHPDSGNPEPVWRFPLNTIFAMSVLAPVLGVAQAVAETYVEVLTTRMRSATKERQIEDKASQIEAASMMATVATLQHQLIADSQDVLDRLQTGRAFPAIDRAAMRMRIATAGRQVLTAAQRVFTSIGGSLLVQGTPMERLFRDLHAMSSHFLLQPEPIGEAYGRLLLGLEPPPGARL